MKLHRILWPKNIIARVFVIGAMLLVVVVGVFTWAAYSTSARLQAMLDKAAKAGMPSTLEEALGPAIPDNENAAVPLDKASIKADKFQKDALKKFPDKDVYAAQQDPEYDRVLFAIANADPDYDALLNQGDRTPRYRSQVAITRPYFNIVLNNIQRQREIGRVEVSIAKHLVAMGKREEAIQRLMRGFRIIRKWDRNEPFLISALVGIAVRSVYLEQVNKVLRSGPLPKKLHDELDKELAFDDEFNVQMKKILQMEALAVIDAMDTMGPLAGVGIAGPIKDYDKAFILEYFNKCTETFDMPYHVARIEVKKLDEDLRKTIDDPIQRLLHINSALYLPAVRSVHGAAARDEAKIRCMRTVNALVKNGDWKLPIDKLGLPETAITDPYTGKPLLVIHKEEGTTVYAVGDDLNDDKGLINWGEGPTPSSYDFGFGPLRKPSKNESK